MIMIIIVPQDDILIASFIIPLPWYKICSTYESPWS